MNQTENIIKNKKLEQGNFINLLGALKKIFFFSFVLVLTACSDFVDIDPPKNTLITETVFEDAATVESALANIYYKMRDDGMVSGISGISTSLGTYSDELDFFSSRIDQLNLYNHAITPSNTTVLSWWTHAYNLIYAANDIIKGVSNSNTLNIEEQERFKGQALFVRAYLHSLLVELFGDIPYIKTTNYLENNTVARMSVDIVYEHIISDLTTAVNLLDDSDTTGEHVIPNKSVANALLARVYLYTENWALAESTANELISEYTLEPDVNKLFLKNSSETLWQFKPNGTTSTMNTQEANQFIIISIPPQRHSLSNSLLAAFEDGDLRRASWVGSITSTDGLTTLYYAHKYKARFNETASLEYSIIFRLAEQYLIRAEARAKQGDISGAQLDLNVIRNRAGLGDTTAATTTDLLVAIQQERRIELFTEQGHRWFDLKRTGTADEVLSLIKSNWLDTNILFPIPEKEIELNPNLEPQNLGY